MVGQQFFFVIKEFLDRVKRHGRLTGITTEEGDSIRDMLGALRPRDTLQREEPVAIGGVQKVVGLGLFNGKQCVKQL